MNEWQPIETAPRDGRAILVLLRPRQNTAAVKIAWGTDVRIAHWNVANETWRLMAKNYDACADHVLSHWMPLPPAPIPPPEEERT
jgi:hypothetical protein